MVHAETPCWRCHDGGGVQDNQAVLQADIETGVNGNINVRPLSCVVMVCHALSWFVIDVLAHGPALGDHLPACMEASSLPRLVRMEHGPNPCINALSRFVPTCHDLACEEHLAQYAGAVAPNPHVLPVALHMPLTQ